MTGNWEEPDRPTWIPLSVILPASLTQSNWSHTPERAPCMVPTAIVSPVFRVCLQLSLVFSLSQVSLTNCPSPPTNLPLGLAGTEARLASPWWCSSLWSDQMGLLIIHFTEEEIVKLGLLMGSVCPIVSNPSFTNTSQGSFSHLSQSLAHSRCSTNAN